MLRDRIVDKFHEFLFWEEETVQQVEQMEGYCAQMNDLNYNPRRLFRRVTLQPAI